MLENLPQTGVMLQHIVSTEVPPGHVFTVSGVSSHVVEMESTFDVQRQRRSSVVRVGDDGLAKHDASKRRVEIQRGRKTPSQSFLCDISTIAWDKAVVRESVHHRARSANCDAVSDKSTAGEGAGGHHTVADCRGLPFILGIMRGRTCKKK